MSDAERRVRRMGSLMDKLDGSTFAREKIVFVCMESTDRRRQWLAAVGRQDDLRVLRVAAVMRQAPQKFV